MEKSQLFFLLLYPDDKEYNCDDTLDLICSAAIEYVYCLHDKDTDVKPHIHLYCKMAQQMSIKSFCETYHTRPFPFTQYALNRKKCIRYMRHLDKIDDGDGSYKYSPEEVISNIDCTLYWEESDQLEGQYINELYNVALNYVDTYDSQCPLSVLFRYAQEQEEDKRYKLINILARRSYFFKTILEQIYAIRYDNLYLDWSKFIK